MWRYATAGYVAAQPVVGHEGTAYFASDDGTLHAVNSETGTKVWTFTSDRCVQLVRACGGFARIEARLGLGVGCWVRQRDGVGCRLWAVSATGTRPLR